VVPSSPKETDIQPQKYKNLHRASPSCGCTASVAEKYIFTTEHTHHKQSKAAIHRFFLQPGSFRLFWQQTQGYINLTKGRRTILTFHSRKIDSISDFSFVLT
jgi:hypothetical protein